MHAGRHIPSKTVRWSMAAVLVSTVVATGYLAQLILRGSTPPAVIAAPIATARMPLASAAPPPPTFAGQLPGMPPNTTPSDLYAFDQPSAPNPTGTAFRPLLYLPDSRSGSVQEIDPRTGALVRRLPVGGHPQRIAASPDRNTLWVLNEQGNTVTAVDPRDGSPGPSTPVTAPHNMYFTLDGHYALIVEQTHQVVAFRDPNTLALIHPLPVTCPGVDHLAFTADGRYALASCAFAHHLIKIDLARRQVVGSLQLDPRSSPQEVTTTPGGSAMYVADPVRGGIWKINPAALRTVGFLPTGRDAHGLYIGRDAQELYITNRSSVSVLTFSAGVITRRWRIPGGTLDLAGLSGDGTTLWLTSRSHPGLYALDTRTGQLRTRSHAPR